MRQTPVVSALLAECFPTEIPDFHQISASDIAGFVQRQAERITTKSAPTVVTALRSFFRHLLHRGAIETDMLPLQSICWNPVPTCAPSSCCLVIAISLPRPSISVWLLPRCALPRVRSIWTRSWLALSRSSLDTTTLRAPGKWIARGSKWRMCSAATAQTIVRSMALRCQTRSTAS